MFYGNELDSEKHLLLDADNHVMLVGQDRGILELIARCLPGQFAISTIDNTRHKSITNLNCLLLDYNDNFKINTNVSLERVAQQNKLLWLYHQLDDLHKFLYDLVEIETKADSESPVYQEMLRKKAEYTTNNPNDKFIAYLFDVDTCLYTADYQSMYEFEDEAVAMFTRVDFSEDLDTIKQRMIKEVRTTYIQNYTHAHNSIKDFFAKNLTK
jgi:hypothetical protein